MTRTRLLLMLAALLLLAACSGSPNPVATTPSSVSASAGAGKYIVVFHPGVSVQSAMSVSQGLQNRPEHSYQTALLGFAGTLSAAEHSQLLNDPRVAYIEPDLPVSVNKGKPGGGGGPGGGGNPSQQLPWGVDRVDAELNGNTGAGIGVAVLDTGVDLDHPDLGTVIDGANFDRPGNPADDNNGHGTHVAGTIAASDNTIGYVGIAPGATIIAVKVLDRRGSGWVSDINAGIDWVAANQGTYNIQVANMSLGGSGFSQSMYDAIQSATSTGVTFVVAAGNESSNAANSSPAGFDNVITVSALNPNDTFASYSNYGSVVDLIAPGTNIPSLWKGGGYNTISGTSMACPHVAGAAALYCASNPGAGFSGVRSGLIGAGEGGSWPGDPDGISEPLLDAQSL